MKKKMNILIIAALMCISLNLMADLLDCYDACSRQYTGWDLIKCKIDCDDNNN